MDKQDNRVTSINSRVLLDSQGRLVLHFIFHALSLSDAVLNRLHRCRLEV